MGVALILAAHGSHISPNTAGVVWGYVDTLRRRGIADEITAAFWKETPHYHHVLNTVTADTVVIVPVFTAAGYFSQQVIPAEMGLLLTPMSPLSQGARGLSERNLVSVQRVDPHPASPVNGRGVAPATEGVSAKSRTIYYTRTLGEHPAVFDVVQKRVREAIGSARLDSARTAVVIIGHGTRRSETTRATTRQQVEAIRSIGLAGDVLDAYLDDEPDIPSIYRRTSAEDIIAVPFFLAPGSHTTRDVPEALGITYGEYPALVNERRVYYTPPVGTDDVICDLIVQLARDSGLPFAEHVVADEWAGFPQAGAADLIEAVQAAGELLFGELLLTPDYVTVIDPSPLNPLSHKGRGDFPVLSDTAQSPFLPSVGERAGDRGERVNSTILNKPSDLRRHLLENPFRPLSTTADMKHDWLVPLACVEQLPAVVETVYPGVLADWAAQRRGTFRYETLGDVAKRQQGIFRHINRVEAGQIAHTVTTVCGQCVRFPTWHSGQTPPDRIPCSSPCNLWLSHVTQRQSQDYHIALNNLPSPRLRGRGVGGEGKENNNDAG